MKNISRRTFLSKIALTGLAAGLSPLTNASVKRTDTAQNAASNVINEYVLLFKEWQKQESTSPELYYVKSMQNYKLELTNITKAARKDFDNKILFNAHGLILSKTEAAFLAVIGAGLAG